ncbi:hypothetical protein Ae168Ps1_0112 [Pseudonocardia sp. Ae168_Ps1]|nr:hypothetical protein Ae150APs1_0116 [Pseudonocardia sp. Ae150A_Ps1]OLL77706.1 hypothetical protein Ae168Ps1_0112 [Pseudonocardia sp. Ae168_Ps1]OLL88171.1 hypothetical protein Ae263Ps1_5226c [Pseudonocardia sp. Ae263_Ps1]OLL91802.1 hypothetical protein Ae356Ps1_1699 [Pseudonocardia sp. Ae356_Ps1]
MSEARKQNESVFTWAAPPLKFGDGAIDEIGLELAARDLTSCLILTVVPPRSWRVPYAASRVRAAFS